MLNLISMCPVWANQILSEAFISCTAEAKPHQWPGRLTVQKSMTYNWRRPCTILYRTETTNNIIWGGGTFLRQTTYYWSHAQPTELINAGINYKRLPDSTETHTAVHQTQAPSKYMFAGSIMCHDWHCYCSFKLRVMGSSVHTFTAPVLYKVWSVSEARHAWRETVVY